MARNVTGVDVGSRTAIALSGRVKGNSFALSSFWAGSHVAESVSEAWLEVPPGTRI